MNAYIILALFLGGSVNALAVSVYFAWRRPLMTAVLLAMCITFGLFAVRYGQIIVPAFPGYPEPSSSLRPFLVALGVIAFIAPYVPVYVAWQERHIVALRAAETERRAMIEEMRRQEEERRHMLELVRQEIVTRLVTNVGHEVRTPLTAIMTYTDMLLAGYFEPLHETQQPPMENVKASARRIGLVVDKFIVMARLELGVLSIETFNLADAIADVIAAGDIWVNARRSPEEVTLEYDYPGLLMIEGDQAALQAAVRELLHNAIKFNQRGGQARIWVEEIGDTVAIAVSDTGIGIETRHYQFIFDSAYQVQHDTKRQYEGAGMGLSLVKAAAAAHRGYIDVESKIGEGSHFRLIIPRQR